MSTPAPVTPLQQLKVLAFALITAPLVMFAAMATVLGLSTDPPPLTIIVALLATPVLAYLTAEAIGFRAAPLPAGRPHDASSRAQVSLARYQSSTFVRFAVCELPILVALVACFVLDHGLWPFAIVILPGVALLAYETWPSGRNLDKYATALERDGGSSLLRELGRPQ